MTDRLACVVPYCGHGTTRWPTASEWICADHWRLVRPCVRRAINLARRRLLAKPAGSPVRERLWVTAGRLWQHARRQAIERAVGIST